ncbi:MAG: hypothetical protein WEA76_09830 [Acidimicrobiia bacterium]
MDECTHVVRMVNREIGVAACGECGTIEWFRNGTPIGGFDGMADVFGMFDLVATLPGVSTPGPEVMLYTAPRGASRGLLAALPMRTWLEAAPGLSISHDGRHLLVSPSEPALTGRPSA